MLGEVAHTRDIEPDAEFFGGLIRQAGVAAGVVETAVGAPAVAAFVLGVGVVVHFADRAADAVERAEKAPRAEGLAGGELEFAVGRTAFEAGSNGIVYRSVRAPEGECIVCFRPKLVKNVRQGAHFEYRWSGSPEPKVRQLP